jgi:hypothetical protein
MAVYKMEKRQDNLAVKLVWFWTECGEAGVPAEETTYKVIKWV